MTNTIDNESVISPTVKVDSKPNRLSWLTFTGKWSVKKILDPLSDLARAQARASRWFIVSMVSLALVGLCIVCLTILALALPDKLNKPQFILSPGIAALETVRPGEMPKSYVEQGFSHVASLVNGWTWESIEDNFNILYEQFYSKDLADRTKANLKALGYVDSVKEKKLVSLWRYEPKESDFRWCGEVQILKMSKGVACGIVTGTQTLYYNINEPLVTRKISYLVFAVNVAPNPTTPGKNFFSFEVVKIKRGDRNILQTELDEAYTKGTLPPESEDFYVRQ